MSVKRCTSLIGGLLILGGSLVVSAPIASANEELMKLQKDDGQWAVQNKNYAGTRYSGLNQITPENAKNLKVAWSFSLGTLNGQQGGPLVVGDTMFVHSSYSTGQSHNIFALDLSKEGAPIKWKYVARHDPKAVPTACCDLVHKG
ncbi:MAG: PQQ-dependent dehydrogenase, methanol/ethanol family, partial [Candidatus Methylomirabilis sp.]